MAKYIVNTTVGDMTYGEIVDLDPSLFADYIEAQWISPIDDHGNRIVEEPAPEAEDAAAVTE